MGKRLLFILVIVGAAISAVLTGCQGVTLPPVQPPDQSLSIAVTGVNPFPSTTVYLNDDTQFSKTGAAPASMMPGDATPAIIIPTQERIIFENPPEAVAGADTAPTVSSADTPGTLPQPIFDVFVESLKNGASDQIVGVYIDGILALRVIQQPPSNPGYVSIRDGEATQFSLATSIANNIGLLAHNNLAGKQFINVRESDLIQVVYGDGRVDEFEVTRILQYQALTPSSQTSDFVNLETGATLSATNLFYEVYGGEYHLTLQTCIARDNNSEWGRLFIIAEPY